MKHQTLHHFIYLCLTILLLFILTGCSSDDVAIDQKPEVKRELTGYIGDWQGNIDTEPGQQAPIVLHISQQQDTLTANIDSPLQNAYSIPLDIRVPTEVNNGKVRFKNPDLQIVFNVNLHEQELIGVIEVGGQQFQINMARQTKQQFDAIASLQAKPQTPKPPFDYHIEDMLVDAGTHQLAATLTLPKGEGRFPAVLLLSGSGPDDKDYSKFGHKRFWLMADTLTQQGIAVLRFDERGVGNSTGDFSQAGFKEFTDDVESLISELVKHPKINLNKIGLLGHSEGAMVASISAFENPHIDFVVLMAGMMNANIGLSLQYQDIAKNIGYNEQDFVAAVKELEQLAIQGENPEQLIAHYNSHFAKSMPLPKGILQQTAGHFTSPAMVSLLSYQPTEYLSKISVPVLALCGQLDRYFDCDSHSASIAEMFKQDRASQLTQVTYANLNHYFQTAKSGTMAEEPSLTETLAPQVMSDISQWIHQQSR